MNVVFIASIVIAATLIAGIILAAAISWFGRLVVSQQDEAVKTREQFNSTLSLGLEIPVYSETEDQMEAARKLAARKAASLPRGGNMKIGQRNSETQLTAHDGLKEDPVTAVKIASFHGWQGAVSGIPSGDQTAAKAARATAQTTLPEKSADDLVPGEDYPFIEITDEMSPAEKRKARIANSKARSAAVKALKPSGADAAAPPVTAAVEQTTQAAPSAAPQPASAPASPSNVPVAGVDYPVIEITDDMDPSEIRRARIANSKARSAAMKAFKEAGGAQAAAPQSSAPEQESSATAFEPEVSSAAQSSAEVPAGIPKPEYLEITDDMDPSEIRQARIHNSKARAAYNKALKAAGIDPATAAE